MSDSGNGLGVEVPTGFIARPLMSLFSEFFGVEANEVSLLPHSLGTILYCTENDTLSHGEDLLIIIESDVLISMSVVPGVRGELKGLVARFIDLYEDDINLSDGLSYDGLGIVITKHVSCGYILHKKEKSMTQLCNKASLRSVNMGTSIISGFLRMENPGVKINE